MFPWLVGIYFFFPIWGFCRSWITLLKAGCYFPLWPYLLIIIKYGVSFPACIVYTCDPLAELTGGKLMTALLCCRASLLASGWGVMESSSIMVSSLQLHHTSFVRFSLSLPMAPRAHSRGAMYPPFMASSAPRMTSCFHSELSVRHWSCLLQTVIITPSLTLALWWIKYLFLT